MTGVGRRSRLSPLTGTGPNYPPGLRPGRSPAVLRLEVPVNTRHAMEIPASALNALRDYAAQRTQQAARLNEVDELCSGTGPLTAADRRMLEDDALTWWRIQHATAAQRVGQIGERLAL
jgi:hypothetical protein